MPPFKTIVLHVGPHKTATSFLQTQLAHHRSGLESAGWALPCGPFAGVDLPPNASYLVRQLVGANSGGLQVPISLRDVDLSRVFRNWLEACETPHLLISAEFMSLLSLTDWQAFRAHLAPYMDAQTTVRVVMFARHPLDSVASLRNQIIKDGNRNRSLSSVASSVRRFMGLPRLMVDVWGQGVSVDIQRFEDAKQEGVWPFVLQLLGLNSEDFPEVLDAPFVASNVSLPVESRLILNGLDLKLTGKNKQLIFALKDGLKDGCTAEEAREVWSMVGEEFNGWLVSQGLSKYDEFSGRLDLSSPDLWSVACVDSWKRCWPELTPEIQQAFLRAFAVLPSSSADWHPNARKRFEALHAWIRKGGAEDEGVSKWRTAGRLIWAVLQDARAGRRNWPATRRALPEPRRPE